MRAPEPALTDRSARVSSLLPTGVRQVIARQSASGLLEGVHHSLSSTIITTVVDVTAGL